MRREWWMLGGLALVALALKKGGGGGGGGSSLPIGTNGIAINTAQVPISGLQFLNWAKTPQADELRDTPIPIYRYWPPELVVPEGYELIKVWKDGAPRPHRFEQWHAIAPSLRNLISKDEAASAEAEQKRIDLLLKFAALFWFGVQTEDPTKFNYWVIGKKVDPSECCKKVKCQYDDAWQDAGGVHDVAEVIEHEMGGGPGIWEQVIGPAWECECIELADGCWELLPAQRFPDVPKSGDKPEGPPLGLAGLP